MFPRLEIFEHVRGRLVRSEGRWVLCREAELRFVGSLEERRIRDAVRLKISATVDSGSELFFTMAGRRSRHNE